MGVRATVPSDFDAIQELNRQISEYESENSCSTINVEYSYLLEGIEYLKSVVNKTDGNHGFVYEEQEKIIGYASLRIIEDSNLTYRNDVKQVQLKNLCVDKAHRGKNIGHQLVDVSKKWAKGQGANNLKVVAMAKNINALRFYQDCGFEEFEITHEMKL